MRHPILYITIYCLGLTLVAGCESDSRLTAQDLKNRSIEPFRPADPAALVRTPDGAVYQGDYRNGLFHGQGQLVWDNGDRYEGGFSKGLRDGNGKESNAIGDVYEGQFSQGYPHGEGHFAFYNGDDYQGQLQQGVFHGQGRYKSYRGTVYEGEFQRGRMQGQGTIRYKGGAVYVGEVRDWQMHGKGEYTTPDKARYAGEFLNDAQHGKGEIDYGNGAVYVGDIVNWMAEGKGVAVSQTGDKYTGQFRTNNYDGKGVLEYRKSGDRYEGEFKNGLRHGFGKYTIADPKGHKKVREGWWDYGQYLGEKEPPKDRNGNYVLAKTRKASKHYDAEAIYYRQPGLLQQKLAGLQAHSDSQTDMYFLGFAAYGRQDVFMKEVQFARDMFDARFATGGRSFVLVNNHKVADKIPMASVTNLEQTLNHLSGVMNREQDILFMYLSSHGSKQHVLDVSLPGVPLNDLPAKRLADLIKQSGIKWKVLVISACYSGGFIEALKDDTTMIMTSARADHVSFGCSDEAEFTYFGEALLKDTISTAPGFVSAFKQAKELIRVRENKENYDHSDPQLWTTTAIEKKLQQWRQSLSEAAVTRH